MFQAKMTVYRADPPEVENVDIELTKKGGKNLGLGFFTSNPHGLLVTDIVRWIVLTCSKNLRHEKLYF